MSQSTRLLAHLMQSPNASITRLQALQELGIFELARCIRDLEKRGYSFHKPRITIINRWAEKTKVCCYSLHSKHFEQVA